MTLGKRTFDRSRKMQDSGSQTKTDNRYDETAIDPIKQDWHIFRGPPDFTHTSLPFLFENRIQTNLNNYDHVFRLTSPYDPMIATDLVDVNVGAGTTTFGVARSNAGDVKDKYGQCQFYNFYADMYRFYSVIAVRYKVTVENLSGERMYVHVMKYNQELPPQNVSNHDMLLWKGVKSYLSTPHAMFWNDTSAQFNDYNAIQIEDDDDLNATPNPDPTATNYAVTRNGSKAVIQHSAQYTPGDFRREIVLDSEISTWTSIAANPSYPERLLIRVKAYDDNIHPTAGSATSYNKSMHYAIKVELEYLTEFKELNPELRYPVVRDPARLTLFSSNR
uniref:Capsid protein n=1 Tax=Fish-associated parvo-like hybrid virus TaxID=3003968 RepID=A0A9E9FYI1_9VIRU|nr:MAG: capsid protein [Fish-associated parvo-like hybrid virus]